MRTAWIVLCLFFVGFGASLIWKSEHGLPAAYARLRAHGVPATAHLVRCAPGTGGGRGVGCRLSLGDRTWDYPEDSAQFRGLPAGAPVAVLVDPHHPTTVYTVHDVDRRTNAGIGSPVLWFGVVLIAAGLGGLVWFFRLSRRAGTSRARRRRA